MLPRSEHTSNRPDRKIAEVEATGGKVWITVERDADAWAAKGAA